MVRNFLILIVLLLAAPVAAQQDDDAALMARQLPQDREQLQLSYAPLVRDAAPAVVNIYTKTVVQQAQRSPFLNDPFFRRFFGDNFSFGVPRERVQRSLGSGVIVRPDGIVITNNHVIEGADEITVILNDLREYDAELLLAEERTDLAILKIETDGEVLPTLPFADSDEALVGDIVLAIGNPFGIGQTVTSGIISATARTQVGISNYGFFIQTDAAVNPGNSGGALVGLDGTLLGINTAIFSRSGGSNGIGFAIPSNMVKTVLNGALNEGRIERPWLGVDGETVTSDLAEGLGLDRPGGVLIDQLFDNGPGEKAGLKPGDVIISVNGKRVVDKGGLKFRVATLKKGESARLVYLRNGKQRTARAKLDIPPENPERDITDLNGQTPFLGLKVASLSPAYNEEIGLPPLQKGVVVLAASRRAPARRYRFIAPGDIILSMNDRNLRSVDQLETQLETAEGEFYYRISRKGRTYDCTIILGQTAECR